MATRRLKDSRQTSVVRPSVDLRVRSDNFRRLETDDARRHLELLGRSLHRMAEVVERRKPEFWGPNDALSDFLHRLGEVLDLFALKQRIESSQPNSDVRLSVSIDPSDSGFPIFLRDFHFLLNEREVAEERLKGMPTDQQLVDHALFTLFRGVFPGDIVLQKLQREYWESLVRFELPNPLRILPVEHEKEENGLHYCRLHAERLDPDHNIPRHYTVYFTTEHWSGDRSAWSRILESALHQGTSTVADMELPYLARQIDRIGGLRLELVERFDIGPFYSRWTENRGPAERLLATGAEDDSMMFLRRYAVHRREDAPRGSPWKRFVAWTTGQSAPGRFTPTLASPWYSVMPHRLIQRVHLEDLDLEDHVVMYGTSEEGELLD